MRLYIKPCVRVPQGFIDVDNINLVFDGHKYVDQRLAESVTVASVQQLNTYAIINRDSTNQTQTPGVLCIQDPLNGVITYPYNTNGTQLLPVNVTTG